MEWWQKFEKLTEILGSETVCLAVKNYFSADEINEFVNSVAAEYDIEDELEN